jgi:carbonic anhydrase
MPRSPLSVALALSTLANSIVHGADITVDDNAPLDYAVGWGIGTNPGDGVTLADVPNANWCDPSYPYQSPIDIHDQDITEVKFSKKPMAVDFDTVAQTKMVLTSNGVELELEGEWLTLEHEGQKYVASQLHFHSPSEHVFNGYYCAGEIHIVMNNVDKSIPEAAPNGHAVFGMCLQTARQSNPFFEKIEELLLSVDGGGDAVVPGWESHPLLGWDIASLKPITDSSYVSYVGSYTTPACNPNINWFLFDMPVPVSISMIEFMQSRFEQPANHRPTQAMMARKITFTQVCDCSTKATEMMKPSTRQLMFGLAPEPAMLANGCVKACAH